MQESKPRPRKSTESHYTSVSQETEERLRFHPHLRSSSSKTTSKLHQFTSKRSQGEDKPHNTTVTYQLIEQLENCMEDTIT